MNLTVNRNGGMPPLFFDFFGPKSFFGRDLVGFDSNLFPARLGMNVPTANITETAKEYQYELAAPGLERKDFSVEVENYTLKISAEKEEEKREDDGRYFRKEYSFNSFIRTFILPENVKAGSIDAKYENGVLKVTVPKANEAPLKLANKVTVS